jgi:hypothetical protein
MRAVTLAVAASFVALAGCSRVHLTPTHAQASRKVFAMQQLRPARPPPPNMSLDTQEADVIARSYARSLSGKTSPAEPEPVLYVAPQRSGAPVRLAPSVPKED